MSSPEDIAVLSCVAALCAAYCDGRRIVRDLRKRKLEANTLRDIDDLQMERLANTLDKSNTVVRDQYDHSLMQMGPSFARGDQEACTQLKNITAHLQHLVLASLKLLWQDGHPVDFRILQDASNESHSKAILCLLSLHQRMVLAGLIGNLSPSITQQESRGSSGYIEPSSPRETHDTNGPNFPHPDNPSPSTMSRLTNLPSAFPPPTSALPTPPSSADASRRSTAGSEPGRGRSNTFGFPRPPKNSNTEPKAAAQSPPGAEEPLREPHFATQLSSPPPSRPPPPLRKPPIPNSPMIRPKSRAGSYATSASNEQEELVSNPWDERAHGPAPFESPIPTSPPPRTISQTNLQSPQSLQAHASPSLTSGSSSIYSMQPSVSSFAVPGADQRAYLPSEKNKFQGLCKSAWRLQTGQQKKALKSRERLVTSYGKQTAPYWACATCEFEGKLLKVGKEERLDMSILEVPVTHPDGRSYTVRWRWRFLFRSHFPMKRSGGWDAHMTVQQRASFGCLFCCALGRNMRSYTGVKDLIDHLAVEHVGPGRWPQDEVLYRMNCIVGERALETADWDVNLVQGR